MNLNLKLLNQMFSNLKVSYISKQKYSTVKFNKGLFKILRFLKENGYIISYYHHKKLNKFIIYLKYNNFTPYLLNVKVHLKKNKTQPVSLYKLLKNIDKTKTYVLSTKKGLLFIEDAIKYRLGGYLLFEIKI